MATMYVSLPLFDEYDYSYSLALEGVSYLVGMKFNERAQRWFLDLSTQDSTPVLQGVGVNPLYPIALDYTIGSLTGYFWLECIADINTEQYIQYPDKLRQYYRFYYIYEG